MQRGRISGGYTIVEVMIFLAISAFMFVVAAFFIQGKQANTQFTLAMNAINTDVQQVINNVSDNNYPPTNMSCQPNGENEPLTISSSGGSQGSNIGCVFLGEVIQFGVKGNSGGQDYNIYTVAGCQYSNCGQDFTTDTPPTGFSGTSATTIDPGPPSNDPCGTSSADGLANITFNLTTCNQLEWGMQTTAMYDYQTGSSPPEIPTNSVGFFGNFAQPDNENGGLVSGSQNVNVLDPGQQTVISGTNNVDEAGMVTDINSYLSGSSSDPVYIPNPYFVVCFSDGRGHVGALTIGGGSAAGGSSGQRLATSIQISTSDIYPFGANGPYCSST